MGQGWVCISVANWQNSTLDGSGLSLVKGKARPFSWFFPFTRLIYTRHAPDFPVSEAGACHMLPPVPAPIYEAALERNRGMLEVRKKLGFLLHYSREDHLIKAELELEIH